MNILIVEDNHTIARQIVDFLSNKSWVIDYAHNGALGVKLALENIYDVILLDLTLPDIDGLDVCKIIKKDAVVEPAVLMLTARDAFEDKSMGFTHGADDYLTKPFDLRELALRCEALARRKSLHQPKSILLGEINLNLTLKKASRKGQSLKLTRTGFTILSLLVTTHPNPVPRSVLMHEIWGDDPPDTDALKSHIYSLRNVLDKPFDKPLLKTLLNIGFKLDMT